MKTFWILLIALFSINSSFGQWYDEEDEAEEYGEESGTDYDYLRVLFADEDYEKLLKEAEKCTFDDKTKNDAEPYLWLSKCLYTISKDENYTNDDKYKKAFYDALTWMGKYYKKEEKIKKNLMKALTEESTAEDSAKINEKSELYLEHREFFVEVKKQVYEMIETEISSGNYAKAVSLISKIAKVSPDNFGQDYLTGACNFQKGDKTSARDSWKKADAELAKMTDEIMNEWEKPDKMILALGIVETAKCMVKMKKATDAKALMDKCMVWFEDYEFFTEYYGEL